MAYVKIKDDSGKETQTFLTDSEVQAIFDFVYNECDKKLTDKECKIIGKTIRAFHEVFNQREVN